MLADLQKIHAHMHIFFTKFGHNQLDPEAGQARPENLVIMNDPDFVPEMQLPRFDLDALVTNSQVTNKTSSQMSPFGSMLLSEPHSPGRGISIPFDLQGSVSSGPHGSPFGPDVPSSAQKPEDNYVMLPADDFHGPGDWGFEIDENGDIIEVDRPVIVQDDLDLPPVPMEGVIQEQVNPEEQDQPIVDDQGDVIMMDDARPEAGAAPPQDVHDAFQDDQPRQAPARRRKRKARVLLADEETQLTKNVMRAWGDDYLTNCGVKKVRPTAGQAKINAMLLTFGLGLGNIGQNLGVPGMIHPLALDFSGDALFTAFTGLDIPEQPRGTRRSASEAIEDDDQQVGRRVKQRLDSEADQQGRGAQGDDVFGDVIIEDTGMHSSPGEIGREAQAPMSDHLSSALRQPWNRGSSALLGSSIRGSAQKGPGRVPSSPLARHGGTIEDVHFSDGPSAGDDFGFGDVLSPGDPSNGSKEGEGKEDDKQKQAEWPGLDIEGQNFLSFMEGAVRENGERREDEDFDINRKWVAFDDVFVPNETARFTAAQAFYHTLCLATKGSLEVQQDGEPDEPFGEIWVGARLGDAEY
ncbi:hypothetical protein F5Y04DRAFT_268994 [Hypomontagnella monticulosa]|nr:hypothetical protein F5Y04DRAFT_268994 [Hypomontagnella monticulosa]